MRSLSIGNRQIGPGRPAAVPGRRAAEDLARGTPLHWELIA
jgi:hypothetical protein